MATLSMYTSVGSSYTSVGSSTIQVAASPDQIGMIAWNDATQDVELTLFSTELGNDVTMLYQPEKSITAYELAMINNLMLLMTYGGLKLHETSLIYIRKYNLERHFKFTSP